MYIYIYVLLNIFSRDSVGVLNATLDLAPPVLVGVAAFLGSEVVLAPLGSHHMRLGVV